MEVRLVNFVEALEVEIAKAVSDLRYEVGMDLNELYYGTPFGPFLFKPFVGLAAIVSEASGGNLRAEDRLWSVAEVPDVGAEAP